MKKRVTKDETGVTVHLSHQDAIALWEILGLGGNLLHGLFEELQVSLGAPRGTAYIGWRRKLLRQYKLGESFVNQLGVVVVDQPGKYGKHNTPHFPCKLVNATGDRMTKEKK